MFWRLFNISVFGKEAKRPLWNALLVCSPFKKDSASFCPCCKFVSQDAIKSSWFVVPLNRGVQKYSVSTNFRLEFIKQSAREVSIFWTLVEREEREGDWGRRVEHGLNLARNIVRAKKNCWLSKFSGRRLYKLQAKISGHAVGLMVG